MNTIKKILIATDLSNASTLAIERGGELARTLGAEVLLVCNFDPSPLLPRVNLSTAPNVWADAMKEEEAALTRLLERHCRTTLEGIVCQSEVLTERSAAMAIVGRAKASGAELIVVGSRGRSALTRILLGSVASKIVQHAHCSVLVAR